MVSFAFLNSDVSVSLGNSVFTQSLFHIHLFDIVKFYANVLLQNIISRTDACALVYKSRMLFHPPNGKGNFKNLHFQVQSLSPYKQVCEIKVSGLNVIIRFFLQNTSLSVAVYLTRVSFVVLNEEMNCSKGLVAYEYLEFCF